MDLYKDNNERFIELPSEIFRIAEPQPRPPESAEVSEIRSKLREIFADVSENARKR